MTTKVRIKEESPMKNPDFRLYIVFLSTTKPIRISLSHQQQPKSMVPTWYSSHPHRPRPRLHELSEKASAWEEEWKQT